MCKGKHLKEAIEKQKDSKIVENRVEYAPLLYIVQEAKLILGHVSSSRLHKKYQRPSLTH